MENEQDSYSPYFSDSSVSLIPSVINRHAIGLGETKPIQYFGRYNFTDPASANKFLTSDQTTQFWNREGVSDKGIAYRVKTSNNQFDRQPYQRPDYQGSIDARKASVEKARSYFSPNPNLIREIINPDGTVSRILVSAEEQIASNNTRLQASANEPRNLARIDNRFYTPRANAGTVQQYLEFAKNYQNTRGGSQSLPIKILANESVPRYSLSHRFPFNNPNHNPANHLRSMAMIPKDLSIAHMYGEDLGARVSSNPKQEVFVPKRLGATKLEGGIGAARRVGNVLPDGSIEIIGKPKVPIALQQAGNILSKAGTFMNYAGIIPMVTSEWKKAKADYENPTTGEVYNSDEVTDIGGMKFADADLATRARFHPDNAENNPDITDEMRAKFYAGLKKSKK